MNVLLLSPEFPDTFWSFKHAIKFLRKKASLPPLGLLTVAAMLPKDWNRRLIDLNVQKLEDEDLEWADCAMIGCMTVQRESAARAIKRCRDAGVKIVTSQRGGLDPDNLDGVIMAIADQYGAHEESVKLAERVTSG